MKRFFRENALSIALLALFLVSLAGQSLAGHRTYNDERTGHGGRPIRYLDYLGTGHFVESVFENWESEFLQMASFVLMTIFLKQKGSSESKPLDEKKEKPHETRRRKGKRAPARRGGWRRRLYENSLSLALFALFVVSFALHAVGGAAEESREQMAHGGRAIAPLPYVGTSRFWFESFQNWQSEFLAVGALIVSSIFLRQKGSPQSKEVDATDEETGA
jgi:hypothetical protein